MKFLRTKYDNISSKFDSQTKKFNTNISNYLKLSIHHCRDERNFDMVILLLKKYMNKDSNKILKFLCI